jgi:hypothetical protein
MGKLSPKTIYAGLLTAVSPRFPGDYRTALVALSANLIELESIAPRGASIADVQINRHMLCQPVGSCFFLSESSLPHGNPLPLVAQLHFFHSQATLQPIPRRSLARNVAPDEILKLIADVGEEARETHPTWP